MTRGTISFHVILIWNANCKLRHVAPLVATWDTALTKRLKFTDLSWLSGRQKTLNGDLMAKADEILRKNGLDRSHYEEWSRPTALRHPQPQIISPQPSAECLGVSLYSTSSSVVFGFTLCGGVTDVPSFSPPLTPRGPTPTAKRLLRVMSGSTAK